LGLEKLAFEQSARQILMSMRGAAHNHIVADCFVKEDVFVEWPEYDEEPPVAESRVSKTAARPKLRMLSEKPAGGFDGIEIMIRYFPVCVERISLKLPLNVRDEIVRLADAHDFMRARTRSRMELKSSRVSGVTGLSAASSNQFSSSGVTSNGFCRCSRTERMMSLTSSLALAHAPRRT
jgi:hypothetical protein